MKKIFKQMLSLAAIFAMVVTLVPTTVSAKEEGRPEISVKLDKTDIKRGDVVTATVKLKTSSNEKFNCLSLQLNYDPDVFSASDIENSLKTENMAMYASAVRTDENNVQTGSVCYTYGIYSDNYIYELNKNADYTEPFEIFNFKLAAKTDAKAGSTPITITDLDTNGDISPMTTCSNEDATVTDLRATVVNANANVLVPLEGIKFDSSESDIDLGNTEDLSLNVIPGDATNDMKTTTWESSDPTIISIDSKDESGKSIKVKALKKGKATITTKNGGFVATHTYSVKVPLKSISFKDISGTIDMNKNDKKQLEVVYNPLDTTDDSPVSWSSDNNGIVDVDDTGKITAIGAGKATITAYAGKVQTSVEVNVKVPLVSIDLGDDIEILKNETKKLDLTFNPEDTTEDTTTIWSSSDTSVLSIDGNGQIRGIKAGTSKVTATVGDKSNDMIVTVKEIPLNEITIDDGDCNLIKNQTKTLNVSYDPDNTTDDKTVSWKTSDESVATVDSNGKITAKSAGTADITATVGDKTNTITVTVTEININSVIINETDNTINKGQTIKYTASYAPDNTTDENKTVVWKSSDETVATIDKDGNLTALKEGNVKLTASIGNIESEPLDLTVKENHLESLTLLQKENDVLYVDGKVSVWVKLNPEDCTDKLNFKWSSSDESIATVDESGNVTAKKPGKVTITATITTEYGKEVTSSIDITIPSSTASTVEQASTTTSSPKTGDMPIVGIVTLAVVTLAGSVFIIRRRLIKQK